MKERTCIPFNLIRLKVNSGAGLKETLDVVKRTTSKLGQTVFSPDYLQTLAPGNRLLHSIGYTAIGLTIAVGYEYARLKNPALNLPPLMGVIPAASISASKESSGWPKGATEYDKAMGEHLLSAMANKNVPYKKAKGRIDEMIKKNVEERKN